MELTGYSDASWAGDIDDRRSVTSYAVYLCGNLVSWCSKKQRVVARSSTESEYRALAHISAEFTWLKSLLHELRIELDHKPIIWCDNLGAGALASNPIFHGRTKHIEIDVHFIREKVANNELEIRYVLTKDQVVDILTKPLTVERFAYLKNKFNVLSTS